MILQLPVYYRKMLNNDHKDYRLDIVSNFLAALTIATIETPFAAPFDTCRLDLIINRKNKNSLLQYFRETKQIKQHFRGVHVLYLKEIFGWAGFLIPFNISRQYIKNGRENLDSIDIFSISALCGITNAITITPWDVMRNYLQKNKNTQFSSLKEIVTQIYSKNGSRGFFVGSSIRCLQIAVGTALSVPLIESYEKEVRGLSL